MIIACQAWSDVSPAHLPWDKDWEDGHYMVVIGLDADNIYFEDPAMLGTRGMIPRQEFLSRWHDYEGAAPFGPGLDRPEPCRNFYYGQYTRSVPGIHVCCLMPVSILF